MEMEGSTQQEGYADYPVSSFGLISHNMSPLVYSRRRWSLFRQRITRRRRWSIFRPTVENEKDEKENVAGNRVDCTRRRRWSLFRKRITRRRRWSLFRRTIKTEKDEKENYAGNRIDATRRRRWSLFRTRITRRRRWSFTRNTVVTGDEPWAADYGKEAAVKAEQGLEAPVGPVGSPAWKKEMKGAELADQKETELEEKEEKEGTDYNA